LSYSGNLLVENRNGLIVDAEAFEANGNGGARCRVDYAGETSGTKPVTVGRRQRV